MNYKYEYTTEDERQALIDKYPHLVLFEEQNITEGNFLLFSDPLLPDPRDPLVLLGIQVDELKASQLEQDTLIMDLYLGGM